MSSTINHPNELESTLIYSHNINFFFSIIKTMCCCQNIPFVDKCTSTTISYFVIKIHTRDPKSTIHGYSNDLAIEPPTISDSVILLPHSSFYHLASIFQNLSICLVASNMTKSIEKLSAK